MKNRMLLINPYDETVTEVFHDEDTLSLESIYATLGVTLIDAVEGGPVGATGDKDEATNPTIGKAIIYVDDEGIGKADQRYFVLGNGLPLAGKALVVCENELGGLLSMPEWCLESTRKAVGFLPADFDMEPMMMLFFPADFPGRSQRDGDDADAGMTDLVGEVAASMNNQEQTG